MNAESSDRLKKELEHLQNDAVIFAGYQEQAKASGDTVGANVFGYLVVAYSHPGKAPMRHR